ncbi:MAG TPA: hypothetical protein DEW39_04705 [Brevibacterium sp.]|nr:hypothetical protein [Brevibacterium sp.]
MSIQAHDTARSSPSNSEGGVGDADDQSQAAEADAAQVFSPIQCTLVGSEPPPAPEPNQQHASSVSVPLVAGVGKETCGVQCVIAGCA